MLRRHPATSPTRREVLLAGTGALATTTGCSALSPPEQSLLIAVNNHTPTRRDGEVHISCDGTELVSRYLAVAAAGPDTWGTVETELTLDAVPAGADLEVAAAFGDGPQVSDTFTMNCSDEFRGDVICVQLEAAVNVRLTEACYTEFPSEEAAQGGVNRS